MSTSHGEGPTVVAGIDVESWRLDAALVNIKNSNRDGALSIPIHAHALEYLDLCKENTETISGRGIMCLPQSPQGENAADRYDVKDGNRISEILGLYDGEWGRYGLTLNAAVLAELKKVAHRDFRQVVILSDRVPEDIRKEMISATGWNIEESFQTDEPIQQDPDTPIGWVTEFDDGERFWGKNGNQYTSISAGDAEERRQASVDQKLGRDALNVYHHLSIYVLAPV